MADQNNPNKPKRIITNLADFGPPPTQQQMQQANPGAYQLTSQMNAQRAYQEHVDSVQDNYNHYGTPTPPPQKKPQPTPSYKHGGVVKATGLAKVHKGEVVIPKKHAKKFKQLSPFFGE